MALYLPNYYTDELGVTAGTLSWVFLALYTFWTVCEIPYLSLGMDLTSAYDERSRLFGGRQAFDRAGMAVGMLAPELFARAAGSPRLGSPRMAAVFGVVTAVLTLVASVRVRERVRARPPTSLSFFQGLRATLRNPGFRVLLAVCLASVVGGNFIAPLTLYVAKYVIQARWVVPYVMLSYLVGSVASIPF